MYNNRKYKKEHKITKKNSQTIKQIVNCKQKPKAGEEKSHSLTFIGFRHKFPYPRKFCLHGIKEAFCLLFVFPS